MHKRREVNEYLVKAIAHRSHTASAGEVDGVLACLQVTLLTRAAASHLRQTYRE